MVYLAKLRRKGVFSDGYSGKSDEKYVGRFLSAILCDVAIYDGFSEGFVQGFTGAERYAKRGPHCGGGSAGWDLTLSKLKFL